MTSTAPSQPPPDESMDELVIDESIKSDRELDEIPGIERYEIGFYGADYPVDALYKRLTSAESAAEGDIFIPDFQRGYIWRKKQADRFIESLLLGLPVPGIFLSTDATNRRLVIDGGQRLRTIQSFMDGTFNGRDYLLGKGIHRDFEGKGYRDLHPTDRRRFDDAIIHATIVRQEKPEGDNRSLLYIFERLNTGGTAAQPHEIRRSLWGGGLNDLIKSLDENQQWREVYGQRSQHMKDQELILRFFALYLDEDRYGKRKEERMMKDFLTSFMARNRDIDVTIASHLEEVFSAAISLVNESLGRTAFRRGRGLNAAVFDSVMVALAHTQAESNLPNAQEFKRCYEGLLANIRFEEVTSSRTSHEANVKERLRLAREAFTESDSQ